MSGRGLRAFTITGALVLAAPALSQELIYLLTHGVGEGYARAMREGGHDRCWTSFVLTVLAHCDDPLVAGPDDRQEAERDATSRDRPGGL